LPYTAQQSCKSGFAPFNPPKRKHSMRKARFEIRLTQEEKDEITQNFKGSNISSSEYLRMILLGIKPKIRKAKKADSHLLYELNKIGVNLNQIARMQNKNNIEHAELLIALDHIYLEVKKIREIYSS